MRPEVLTLGEAMAVVYPSAPVPLDQATSLTLNIAGAEANVAIALSRLGQHVRFLSRLGDDPFGRLIRHTLRTEGVETSYVLDDPSAPTGVFFREWLADGLRRNYYYRAHSAASRLAPEDIPPQAFTGIRLLHLTGITPALSPSCAASVAYAIEQAHRHGALVSFDPNYRPQLWDPETARAVLIPLMAQADMLLMSHEDAQVLLGCDDDKALARGAALGARIVVLRMAERGACALVEGKITSVPAEPVEAVVDPVGAGDGFNAGFLAGWLRGDTIKAALRLGAHVGAASVAAVGDYAGYPSAE
jgi:2-dehydro-3-deoxygluconokinase